MEAVAEEKVEFWSAGHRLAGILYHPREVGRRPALIVCHGFAGIKEGFPRPIAQALARAGYLVLTFDYRGFGESEGPRWRLIPDEQVEDVRNALTYLASCEEADPTRLALWGISFGGGHAVRATAADPRIRCVVAQAAVADGRRWLRGLRRNWEWTEFLKRIEADRLQRVRTGVSDLVDPLEIMLPDPETARVYAEVLERFPQRRCRLPLETADRILEYAPDAVVHQVAPRALLCIHAAADVLVPPEESEHLHKNAGEPKRLVMIPDATHFTIYEEPHFQRVLEEGLAWLDHYL